jgi:small-conductance mechanosensitive channel
MRRTAVAPVLRPVSTRRAPRQRRRCPPLAGLSKRLALDVDLATRRSAAAAGPFRGASHAVGPTSLGPVEAGEAEVFHAISVAMHGPPGPLTRAAGHAGVLLLLAWLATRLLDALLARLLLAGHSRVMMDSVSRAADQAAGSVEHAILPPGDTAPLLRVCLGRPVTTLVWATAGALAANSVLRATGWDVHAWALPLLMTWQLCCVACVAWAVVLYAGAALDQAAQQWPRRKDAYKLLHAVLSRLVAVVATVAALAVVHVPLRTLLTFGGATGVIVGLGARELAGNAIAGWGLLMTHRLAEGDSIELVGRGIQGKVAAVGLTTTSLLSVDGTHLTVPNSQLGAGAVRNLSRRVEGLTHVGATFDVDCSRCGPMLASELEHLERYLVSHQGVVPSAADGALKTGVSVTAAPPGRNAVRVHVNAYVVGGEAAARHVLLGCAYIMRDLATALPGTTPRE